MRVRTLLLDADGNLFPSEEPAFVASTDVVNRLLAELGLHVRYEPDELRLAATGSNFRTTIAALVAERGHALSSEDVERWVEIEKRDVTEHLRLELKEDEDVRATLLGLSADYELAVVSSSALSRLDACFAVTGLAPLLPPERRFSAEDSLETPTSKPDPAVYTFALEALGLEPDEAVAIEDSPTGATSAVAAGIRTIGCIRFVASAERERRVAELRAAGVATIIEHWSDLPALLARH